MALDVIKLLTYIKWKRTLELNIFMWYKKLLQTIQHIAKKGLTVAIA